MSRQEAEGPGSVGPPAPGQWGTFVEHTRSDGDVVAAELAAQGVSAVALTYVDNSGISRVKGVPVASFGGAVERGVGMSPVFDAFLVDDSIARGRFAGGPVGDLRLLPDPARAVRLAALPGWAWAPVDRHSQDGRPHPQCARTFASRAVQHLAERGLETRMGFEVEWYVDAGHGDDLVPAAPGPAYGINRLIELGGYCHDVLSALADQGVAVGQIHPEYTTSQFELSVLPEDPVGAADTTMLVRHTIHAVSQAHGLRASSPAVMVGGVGNGGHVHVSLQRDGRNVTVDAEAHSAPKAAGSSPACWPSCRRSWPWARPAWPATCDWCRTDGQAPITAGVTRTARPWPGSSPTAFRPDRTPTSR